MMENSLINSINSNQQNRALFAPVLDSYYAKPENARPTRRERLKNYRHDLFDPRTKAFKYTAASLGAIVIGTTGAIVGRGNYEKIRRAVFTNIEELKETQAAKQTLSAYEKAKKGTSKALGFYFIIDKLKDNILFVPCKQFLGWPGKKLTELSKLSGRATAWVAHLTRWDPLVSSIKANDKYLREAIEALPEEKKGLIEPLLDHNKVAEGFYTREKGVRNKAVACANEFYQKYFPKNNLRKGLGRIKADLKNGNDLVRADWNKGIDELRKSLDGDEIGRAMNELELFLDENPGKLSRVARSELHKIVDKYNDFNDFAVDNYGGRLLDLEQGGGMTEMITPLVASGIIAKNTMKGETNEQKRENFVKSGGVGFTGGLAVWMGSIAVGLNGPKGILVSILSGLTIDNIAKIANRAFFNNKKSAETEA